MSKPKKRSYNKHSTETLRVATQAYMISNNGLVTDNSSFSTFTRTRSRTGTTNPKYKAQIRDVVSATTAMDLTDFSWSSKPYSSKFIAKKPPFTAQPTQPNYSTVVSDYSPVGYPNTPPSFSGSSYETAYNKAVSKLYNQIRDLESRASVGEDLGEISQTYRMILKPMRGILDLTAYVMRNHDDALKKAHLNSIKHTVKSLADCVLEYRFGIKPIINTLAEAKLSLENRTNFSFYAPIWARGKDSVRSLRGQGDVIHAYGGASYIAQDFTENVVRFKGIYALISNLDRVPVNKSLGLTWRETIPTLYNLIPYSFLLDYVSNLGDILESLAVPWGNVRWCNLTQRVKIDCYTSFYGAPVITNWSKSSFSAGYSQMKVFRVKRTNQTASMPFPSFQVKKPSTIQEQNIAALILSRIPVIGRLTKKTLRSPSGKDLDYKFRLVARDRNLKIPYPAFGR